jgi:hypothetical protein
MCSLIFWWWCIQTAPLPTEPLPTFVNLIVYAMHHVDEVATDQAKGGSRVFLKRADLRACGMGLTSTCTEHNEVGARWDLGMLI